MADQTTTPNPYTASEVSVGRQDWGGLFQCYVSYTVPLPDRSAVLATGEAISYSFDL